MRLKSIRIRHYKSIDDVSLELSYPITVLVGPNAVGKSNLVDCLRFVRDAVSADLEHAVSSRGGIERVRQYSKTKPYKVHIRLEGDEPSNPPHARLASYEFALETLKASNYVVDSERAVCFERGRDSDEFVATTLLRDRSGDVASAVEGRPLRVAPDQLALGQLRSLFRAPGRPIERFVREWRFASVYPNRLREPSSPDKDTMLAEDGRNWASVLKALRRTVRGRASLDRIYEAMRSVVPAFEEVTVTTVGSYLVPRFRFASGAGDHPEFDPVQLSDGTLRIFGILLALYQTPPPTLLVIEEPEQTVHPGVLGVLADAFREASQSTQIVVTTHSPHFIDHFTPEEVRVVELEGGLTRVGRIRQTQVEAVKQRLMSLQDFMLAEGLQPELQ